MATVLVGSTGAWAQACTGVSPFTDVAPSDFFCQSTEWLKNRQVTLGCGGTSYCPGDVVTRGTMAAFMKRLGTALTPEILYRQAVSGAITLPGEPPDPAQLRCVTIDSEVVAYPRQVLVSGALAGLADLNDVSWRAFVLVSTDAGATWATLNGVNTVPLRAGSGPGGWSTASVIEKADLAPNLAYRFSIGVRRDNVDAGTIGNFIDSRCHLAATIYNRNGTSSPLDAQ
ncbi:MAG TPA: hypothetical protein VNE58_11505 [Casimicrobiaceae bacterium]|nr:hypothetical protein [Casimicrobiaceae bacterium]